jgi:hypothetical protein
MKDARKPLHDYAGEAEVRAACDRLGVLETAQADFIDEFRANLFTRAEIADHIEKSRETKPQRWASSGKEDDELFVSAFGPTPNLTAQGAVIRKHGETRAAEIAASFGVTLYTNKPGKTPEHIKVGGGEDKGGNPFNRLRDASGKVNEAVSADIGRLMASWAKTYGPAKAREKIESMARSAGKTITGLSLRQ